MPHVYIFIINTYIIFRYIFQFVSGPSAFSRKRKQREDRESDLIEKEERMLKRYKGDDIKR
jgi:hypothetical protein